MKKIMVFLLSIILLTPYANAQIQQTANPYSLGPEGRRVEDLRDFAKPAQMMAILPNRPVAATDASGNRQYFSPNSGKLAASVSKDGHITFNLIGISKTFDAQGNLVSTEENIAGTNMKVTKNEFGEVTSYKETGLGGVITKEYDKDKNLVKTYTYDTYGKTIIATTNELTRGKTIYNEKGLPIYDEDFEGNRTAKYEYNDRSRLVLKTDMYGNTTHYDENQNVTETRNKEDIVIVRYNYGEDSKGNYVLLNTYDVTTKETTYYKDGKQTYTKNREGAIVTDYNWYGSKLISTFNRTNQQTTYYDINERVLYITYDREIISKNLYYKGQLVGTWDRRTNQVTIYKNERREMILQLDPDIDQEPTAENVKAWIDAGLIDQKYLFQSL